MLSVPVVNMQGQRVGAMEIDPAVLGSEIRPQLIKQAVVTFLDHQRLQAARTKGRSQIAGSTRKLYRQKGTGNARAGTLRNCVRRGGGRAFGKQVPGAFKGISKKMRRLACGNALLSRLQANDVIVVDELRFGAMKTKPFVKTMGAIGVEKGCVLAMHERDENLLRSGRNVERVELRHVDDLNAYDVMLRPKVVFTRPAMERFVRRAAQWRSGSAGE